MSKSKKKNKVSSKSRRGPKSKTKSSAPPKMKKVNVWKHQGR